MEYKYKKTQLFAKRLDIPKDVQDRIYRCNLSLREYVQYELNGKIPTSCLMTRDRLLLEKFGFEKVRILDFDLIGRSMSYNIKDLYKVLEDLEYIPDNLNHYLYELVADDLYLESYTEGMRVYFSDRFFNMEEVEEDKKEIVTNFLSNRISLSDILFDWDLFKDKDLDYFLKRDYSNRDYNLRTKNILGNRYLDLKLRQAEILQGRDYIKKYAIIKQAIDELSNIEIIDDKTAVNLLKALTALSYAYYHFDSIKLIADTLDKYSYAISRLDRKNREKLLSIIQDNEESIDNSFYQRIYINLSAFKMEASSISNENEGLVVKIKENYGFISNANYAYNKGLFFSKNNAYEGIKVGDNVSFEIYTTSKGPAAKNIEKI